MLNSQLSVPQQVSIPRDVPQFDPADPEGSLRRLVQYTTQVMPRVDELARASSATARSIVTQVGTLDSIAFKPKTAVRYTNFIVQDDTIENIYLVNTGAGNLTAQLPRSEPWKDRIIVFTKVTGDANTLTITPTDGLVAGAASVSFAGAYGSRSFVSDGVNWWAVACC